MRSVGLNHGAAEWPQILQPAAIAPVRAVDPVRERYDYILIDTPPSLGLLTINALTASEGVIVPVQCEYLSLRGLLQLLPRALALEGAHITHGLTIDDNRREVQLVGAVALL